MKIIVLNGSARKNGNTETMANTFAATAREAGHEVSVIRVEDVNPCKVCMYCAGEGHKGECVQQDDMTQIYREMETADMMVFASPIYWFSVSAQLKCAIDRFYAPNKVGFHIRSAALLLNSHSENVFDGSIAMYKDLLRYLKWEDKGIVAISGMTAKDSMQQDPRLQQVIDLAKNL